MTENLFVGDKVCLIFNVMEMIYCSDSSQCSFKTMARDFNNCNEISVKLSSSHLYLHNVRGNKQCNAVLKKP